jgi:hypothetical protein
MTTQDSWGHPEQAIPLYRKALARHLPRYNRAMANYGKALLGLADD